MLLVSFGDSKGIYRIPTGATEMMPHFFVNAQMLKGSSVSDVTEKKMLSRYQSFFLFYLSSAGAKFGRRAKAGERERQPFKEVSRLQIFQEG